MENRNKLVSVIKEAFSPNNYIPKELDNYYGEKYLLQSDILKNEFFGKKIFSCEEFSEVESIEIVDHACFNVEGATKTVGSIKISEGTRFKGKIYVYQIQLSPENYDMYSFMQAGQDNILLTPPVYSPNDFIGKQGITLFFNPETAQDMSVPVCVYNNKGERIEEDKFKKSMHKLLDKALDNREKYKAIGFRNIIIRGYFPEEPTKNGEAIKIII